MSKSDPIDEYKLQEATNKYIESGGEPDFVVISRKDHERIIQSELSRYKEGLRKRAIDDGEVIRWSKPGVPGEITRRWVIPLEALDE